jgi:hypothetical protein
MNTELDSQRLKRMVIEHWLEPKSWKPKREQIYGGLYKLITLLTVPMVLSPKNQTSTRLPLHSLAMRRKGSGSTTLMMTTLTLLLMTRAAANIRPIPRERISRGHIGMNSQTMIQTFSGMAMDPTVRCSVSIHMCDRAETATLPESYLHDLCT